jgi:hypothetical protein
MSVLSEAIDKGATGDVLSAASIIQSHIDMKLRPPTGLVDYLRNWVASLQGQNRWGK